MIFNQDYGFLFKRICIATCRVYFGGQTCDLLDPNTNDL